VFRTTSSFQKVVLMGSPTPPLSWRYENLLALDENFREKARLLVQSRLPNYTYEHCTKLLGGSPYEYASRCALNEENELIGVMAFTVGQMDTVEIVAFVAAQDGKGIGRFLMEAFINEMGRQNHKSAILTYIEPSAFAFFSRFGFSKNVPARSLYERITSKYVGAIFMYRDLLESLPKVDRKQVCVGDRLLVVVDGTLVPRQAQIKDIEEDTGKVFVHYYFWNPRHDEWIHLHSPRIRWDLPLPPEAPKRHGENSATLKQVKEVLTAELKKEKKLEIVESNGSWPRPIKRNGIVQVRVEGNWIEATVIQKTDMYLFCEFEYKGSKWQQDFPRESVRLGPDSPTVLELLLKKSIVQKRKSGGTKGPSVGSKRKKPITRESPALTPPKPKAAKRARRFSAASTMEDGVSLNSISL
jgi:hypothetical protein